MKPKSLPKRRLKKPVAIASAQTAIPPTGVSFPIVGIGASAGGLEALEKFFSHLPASSGMAFVVVQHLDPTRKGMMPELLQRATGMRVFQVRDRTRVRPDHVYVIPPNKNMSILHGVLHLLAPVAPRGLRLPINFFFHSLAQDQQGRSVAVILSGMGSDGTLGLRTIKEKAGVALVQEPTTAKFDAMPRSAIEAGLADIIAPVEDLPGRIIAYLARKPLVTSADFVLHDKTHSALSKVVILLRAHTGHDFSLYKRNTLYPRIERRMGIHQIKKMEAYIRYLQENSQELDLLFKELLIGVTSFFRDPAAWDQLRKEALPRLLARPNAVQILRAWVPACSTGEEAYSLAIVFKEVMADMKPKGQFALQIFATDLDRDAVDKARRGNFPENIAADVSRQRLEQFFTKEEHGYRVRKEIREMVIFAQQNLIMDPPFTRLDILSCRNLLIYLAPEMQKKLIPLFHHNLSPGGLLFLGSSETVGDFPDLFANPGAKSRLFQRVESPLRAEPVEFPSFFSSFAHSEFVPRPTPNPPPSLQSSADKLILERYAPPAALVNKTGDIFYISGRTGKYLEPAAGKANWNIFAMAREGLRYELTAAFQKVLRQPGLVTIRSLKIPVAGGEQTVVVTMQLIDEVGPLQGLVMITFADVAATLETKTTVPARGKSAGSSRLVSLVRELQKAHEDARTQREDMQTSQEELRSSNEEVQSTNEELQSTNEELQSTNEEMQSSNEELQSTNEELTTSKEEMQSLNEELQTVNVELQAKLDELARSNNDLNNLLNSTDIATLFLDRELKVRRFTTQAAKIIKLIPGDIGRPISDLATDLHYPELMEDGRAVLVNLVAAEKSIVARDGRRFNVRIIPYRTSDDRIDGVMLTFADITAVKAAEAKLKPATNLPAAADWDRRKSNKCGTSF